MKEGHNEWHVEFPPERAQLARHNTSGAGAGSGAGGNDVGAGGGGPCAGGGGAGPSDGQRPDEGRTSMARACCSH